MKVTVQWLMADGWHEEQLNVEAPVLIGRLNRCRVTINDPTVSREHATLYLLKEVIYVRNLSNTNPIRFLDGTVLEVNESYALSDSSSFTLGKVKVRVVFDEQEGG